ncbi:MAG: methyltransferase family protein [Syntrophales bacterium]
MKHFTAYAMMAMAILIGGGSLLLFGVFLVIGPITIVRICATEHQALLWDGLLSLLFFVQHSGMVRTSFGTWLAPIVPRHYHPSTYAIVSGIVLTAVVLLWQPSQTVLYQAEGMLRLLARAISVLAIVGFAWGVRALGNFDTFGLIPIRVHLRGRQLRAPAVIIRGPYLWVRHPLYFFMLVLIWSFPDVSLDRLLFNVLWTLWIVLGTYLEEKDLVAEFGEKYRHYQKTVPMLFPWRFPRGIGSAKT